MQAKAVVHAACNVDSCRTGAGWTCLVFFHMDQRLYSTVDRVKAEAGLAGMFAVVKLPWTFGAYILHLLHLSPYRTVCVHH